MAKYANLLLGFLLLTSVLQIGAFAQISEDSTGDAFEKGMNPVIGILKGFTNVMWKLMQFFVGKDDVSIAYFSYNLGFRDDEVYIHDMEYYQDYGTSEQEAKKGNCSVGGLDIRSDPLTTRCGDERNATLRDGSQPLTKALVGDYNEDDTSGQVDDVFRYINKEMGKDIEVADGAKGQIMIFAIGIPAVILFFVVADFFMSTGMLRSLTSNLISAGITLIALRSGVFTGLLNMISNIFGARGFFMSLLGIYLIFAVLIWFYGGIRKSWALASDKNVEKVADAVVDGFTLDLRRGLKVKEAAEELDKNKK